MSLVEVKAKIKMTDVLEHKSFLEDVEVTIETVLSTTNVDDLSGEECSAVFKKIFAVLENKVTEQGVVDIVRFKSRTSLTLLSIDLREISNNVLH